VCGGKGVWEEPVGHQPLEERNQEVDAKKEVFQKDSRIRGTKKWSSEKIPGSSGCCGKKDFRIRGTKEWSKEKIPGSGGRCGKMNKTKRMQQRKDSRIRWRCVKKTPGSGGQNNGAEKIFQDQVVAAERRTSGSGGQKNEAENRFQDQAVDTQKEQNREKIPGSGGGASKGLKDQGDKRME
jgi:hypothetical protein